MSKATRNEKKAARQAKNTQGEAAVSKDQAAAVAVAEDVMKAGDDAEIKEGAKKVSAKAEAKKAKKVEKAKADVKAAKKAEKVKAEQEKKQRKLDRTANSAVHRLQLLLAKKPDVNMEQLKAAAAEAGIDVSDGTVRTVHYHGKAMVLALRELGLMPKPTA